MISTMITRNLKKEMKLKDQVRGHVSHSIDQSPTFNVKTQLFSHFVIFPAEEEKLFLLKTLLSMLNCSMNV